MAYEVQKFIDELELDEPSYHMLITASYICDIEKIEKAIKSINTKGTIYVTVFQIAEEDENG